jgi:hypothetical protein
MTSATLRKATAAILAVALSSYCLGSGQGELCDHYWESQGQLIETEVQLYTSESIPEVSRPIPGLKVKSFTRANGAVAIPESIEESNCYFKRAFRGKISRALQFGARDASRHGLGLPEADKIEQLVDSLNARLDRAVGGKGAGGIGFLRLGAYVEGAFGFSRWDATNQPPLQRAIVARGICETNKQLVYLMMSYIASMGETDWTPERFKSYFGFEKCSQGDLGALLMIREPEKISVRSDYYRVLYASEY